MADTYTSEEFAESFRLRGYGKRKQAQAWIEQNGLSVLTEDDFMRCYYAVRSEMILPHGRRYIALRNDGANMSAPQNQPNSSGAAFTQLIRSKERAIERMEAAHKAMRECGISLREGRESEHAL